MFSVTGWKDKRINHDGRYKELGMPANLGTCVQPGVVLFVIHIDRIKVRLVTRPVAANQDHCVTVGHHCGQSYPLREVGRCMKRTQYS